MAALFPGLLLAPLPLILLATATGGILVLTVRDSWPDPQARRRAIAISALAGPMALGLFLAGTVVGDRVFRSRLAQYETLARRLDDAGPAGFERELRASSWSLRLCCVVILPALRPNAAHDMKLIRFVLGRGHSYLFVVSDSAPSSLAAKALTGFRDSPALPRDFVLAPCTSPDLPAGWCREQLTW